MTTVYDRDKVLQIIEEVSFDKFGTHLHDYIDNYNDSSGNTANSVVESYIWNLIYVDNNSENPDMHDSYLFTIIAMQVKTLPELLIL